MPVSMSGLSRRAALVRLVALAVAPAGAGAQGVEAPPEVVAQLPGVRLHGSGRLKFMMLSVYNARLWVGPGFEAAQFERAPLALELIYERKLYGKLIAERSLEEMKRAGGVGDAQAARWLAALTALIPDVKDGDRLTGVQRPGEAVAFFVNGRAAGELRDADFTRRFFAIWLAPTTSEPRLRQQLIGAAQSAS